MYKGYLYLFSYLPWDMWRKNLLLTHSLKALSPSPQSWVISTPSPVVKLIGSSLYMRLCCSVSSPSGLDENCLWALLAHEMK